MALFSLLFCLSSLNFFCNPKGCCHSKFVWVTSSVSICLITAFTFLVTSLSFLWSTFLKGRYSSASFLIIKAFSSSIIRCSSSAILVSTRTRISVSLGYIGRISFCILSSITGMSLISWFSSPCLGVKIFLLISSNSTSISHSFVLTTLTWSTRLCSVISKVPIFLSR